ncbi:MAG: Tat pathway signal sequence domain protein, partial [Streptomyces sp.]|nr:Tat pathway signal sequence domain protein [Streptomyces sp.]
GAETVSEAAGVDPAMMRPIWAMIANHYTRRRGVSASYLTQIAAKAAPEGGGGDYGPNSGGYDQLGFGTLAFTREKGAGVEASPEPSASASAAGSDPRPRSTASASASASPSADGDLAATGSHDLVGWSAAAGVTAVAGGLLLLRRRDRGRRGAAE